MDTSIFWDNIKTLIKQSNTTQRGLAVKCGFSPRSIETWIASNQLPDAFQTYKIAQNLGVPLEFLITGEKPDTKAELQNVKNLMLEALEKLNNIM